MSRVVDTLLVLTTALADTIARYGPGLTNDELSAIRSDVLIVSRALANERQTLELYAGADITDGEAFMGAMRWRAETRIQIVQLRGTARRVVEAIDEKLAGAYRERAHIALLGDTLQDIALRYLGDAGLFWRIAEANGIDPAAASITPGTKLRIPEV